MNSEQEANEVKDRNASYLWQIPGVIGVGVEEDDSGQFVLTVHVKDDNPDTVARLPTEIEGYPVKVESTGPYRKR